MFRENRDKEKQKKESMCSEKKKRRVLGGGRCEIIIKIKEKYFFNKRVCIIDKLMCVFL